MRHGEPPSQKKGRRKEREKPLSRKGATKKRRQTTFRLLEPIHTMRPELGTAAAYGRQPDKNKSNTTEDSVAHCTLPHIEKYAQFAWGHWLML